MTLFCTVGHVCMVVLLALSSLCQRERGDLTLLRNPNVARHCQLIGDANGAKRLGEGRDTELRLQHSEAALKPHPTSLIFRIGDNVNWPRYAMQQKLAIQLVLDQALFAR